VKYTGTAATITVMGELDIAVVGDIHEMVKLVVAHEGLTTVHLDVKRLRFIDSVGRVRRVVRQHAARLSSQATRRRAMRELRCAFGLHRDVAWIHTMTFVS
jgi:anti-anti-sigma factor